MTIIEAISLILVTALIFVAAGNPLDHPPAQRNPSVIIKEFIARIRGDTLNVSRD